MTKKFGRLFTINVLVVSALVLFAQLSAHALSPIGQTADKEKVLRQAQAVVEKDEPSRTEMREIIALLTRSGGRFPNELRFPIYLAEAYYKLADPAAPIDREFSLYEKAGTYAGQALKLDPKRVEGHYWYGLYLLKKAQKTGGVRAYVSTRAGIKELEIVRTSLPSYDHAGASRVLSLLYCQAPGWTPFGDVAKAVRLGEEAVRIDPAYPPNHLGLADAYYKRGEKAGAVREYRRVLALPSHSKEDGEKARQMLAKLGATAPN